MPKEFSRSERVGDAILREVAELIRSEIRDPRIGMVSVNAVKVPRDLSTAKIYVTFVDNPKDVSVVERIAVLNKASGFLRSAIGQEIQMRSIPKLNFVHDETVYQAEHISKLIDEALEKDTQKQQLHQTDQQKEQQNQNNEE